MRNTPAYAGKTRWRWKGTALAEKHPRVCGEDQYKTINPRIAPETPPRMRGRPKRASDEDAVVRNTPAYAGKTRTAHTQK